MSASKKLPVVVDDRPSAAPDGSAVPTGSLALRSRPGDVRHVGWSLGNYCNARCAHCYSWQVRQSPRVLTRADVDRILGELVRTGVRTANLGGNEPLFTDGPDPRRTLLPYIVERLAAAGITVGITTNGTTARWMARHAPEAFDHVAEWHMSVDSPFPAEHDANRGGNYFELVQRAMGEARRRGATISLAYCVMKGNCSDAHADALLDLAAREGVELRVNTLKPTDPHHGELMPSAREVFAFYGRLVRRSEPLVVGESVLAGRWGLPSEGCPCGTTSLRIHSITDDGRVPVSPCVFLHDLAVGDLLTQSLDELTATAPFQAMRARREDLPAPCRARACGRETTCRAGCAARTLLVTGTLDAQDPYCPADAPDAEVAEALPCAVVVRPERIRVHERYLCTFVARPREVEAGEEV